MTFSDRCSDCGTALGEIHRCTRDDQWRCLACFLKTPEYTIDDERAWNQIRARSLNDREQATGRYRAARAKLSTLRVPK